ncbi:ribose-phosphate pyrophosphokinase [Candidatus Uhrbacteria bacterium]|nr:ribose-phosphate pyrophosphokinase [Candidatus Uhrbacteria bacterium]
MIVFGLPPHERLSRAIARSLRARVGRVERRVFSDGERYVRPVTSVRGQDVTVIANTGPTSDALVDLLILLHALHASGARSIVLAIPYLAYARQDRSDRPQASVTIALLARLLETAGADRIVLVDPHSDAAVRAFRVPVRIIDPLPEIVQSRALDNFCLSPSSRGGAGGGVRGTRVGGALRAVIAAPDAGARDRAQRLARLLGARDVVVLRKGRPRPNVARVAALTPADQRRVAGRPVVLVDDIIDTAGTITAAAQRLRAAGATHIAILATHAVLSGPAIDRLRRARIDRIVVSDSLPLPRRSPWRRRALRVVSIATSLTKTLRTP